MTAVVIEDGACVAIRETHVHLQVHFIRRPTGDDRILEPDRNIELRREGNPLFARDQCERNRQPSETAAHELNYPAFARGSARCK